jgi:hypothetical protein
LRNTDDSYQAEGGGELSKGLQALDEKYDEKKKGEETPSTASA